MVVRIRFQKRVVIFRLRPLFLAPARSALRQGAPLAALCCIAVFAARAAAAEVSGRVFLDQNENGRFDAADAPLADCLISDAVRLVRTDRQGRYVLDAVADRGNVFVINPPGTWPSGAWWVHVVEGEGKQTADFVLRKAEQSEPFYFVQGTDMHIRPDAMPQYRQYLDHVNGLATPPAFVVHTGDLVIDALRATPPQAKMLFDLYEDATAGLQAPVRNVIGNHEHVAIALKSESPASEAGKAIYRRRFGPTSYAFRYGECHFIVLDGTTLDPTATNGYRDGLDSASAAWAVEYLRSVNQGEPVVVLIHQPLGQGPNVERLIDALAGKRLLLTLCGHGHNRTIGRFGGSPAIMGGAVSYAWHGLIPYPPDPWAYVLFRVENNQIDHVFLDWAHRRAIEVARPRWEETLGGAIVLEGTVSDLKGTLRRVVCQVAQQEAEAELSPAGPMKKRFQAQLNLADLADGAYDLTFTLEDERGAEEQRRPILVLNGKSEPFQAAGAAELKMRVSKPPGQPGKVLVNGQSVGTIPPADKSQELTFTLEPVTLGRLNSVAIRLADGDKLELSNLHIELAGSVRRDVRFAPRRPLPISASRDGAPSATFYLDLRYEGPRGR